LRAAADRPEPWLSGETCAHSQRTMLFLPREYAADGCSMLIRMFVAAVSLVALVGCAADAGRVGVVSGGEPRSYLLIAPPGGDSTPPLPIALHGWLGTPEQMARMSGLSSAAARLKFAVVYPRGDCRGKCRQLRRARRWRRGSPCGVRESSLKRHPAEGPLSKRSAAGGLWSMLRDGCPHRINVVQRERQS